MARRPVQYDAFTKKIALPKLIGWARNADKLVVNVFLARQPIYDAASAIHGYELLFRGTETGPADVHQDLYALGVVVLQILSGMPPGTRPERLDLDATVLGLVDALVADDLGIDPFGQRGSYRLGGLLVRPVVDRLTELIDRVVARIAFAERLARQLVLVEQFRHQGSDR